MKIKRFEAADIKTALAMIKEEMGDDAVILATKTLPNSAKKNNKSSVEVVAAIDFDAETLFEPHIPAMVMKEQHPPRTGYGDRTPHVGMPFPPQQVPGEDSDHEFNPVTNLKITGRSNNFKPRNFRSHFANLLKHKGYPEAAKSPTPCRLPPRHPRQSRRPVEEVRKWRTQLIEQLQIKQLKIGMQPAPTILALVGATGVGKTTTAAKLAAWFSLHGGYKVTLLSMDCYRIGATDQLRTYARIMRIPCELALSKKDLHQAITKHRNRDLIIIDTAGKSPYDKGHIAELRDWFTVSNKIEPYLVLSATSKKEDIDKMVKNYETLATAGIMLTKLDETRAYAALCQQIVASTLPIACLCTGQRVPEDFLPASKDFLHTLFGQGWAAAAAEMGMISEQRAWS